MPSIKSKTIRHPEKQDPNPEIQRKKQIIEVNPEMTQISQLPDRDFKITMVNMVKEAEEEMVKIEEMMDKTAEKMQNIN